MTIRPVGTDPARDSVGRVHLSRRGMFVGLGVLLAAPTVLAINGPASADQVAAGEVECLADLLEGSAHRADLLAG